MHANEITLMVVLSVILLISPFISNFLRLPISMVEIALGAVAASLGLLHKNHLFDLMAEVGFLYLMLLAGMEVNLKELIKLDKKFFLKGILFISFLYLFTLLWVIIFHLKPIFAAIVPLVSIGLILSIQQEIGKTHWLEMALKVGVLGELLSILGLTIMSGYFEYGFGKELLFNIVILFLFLAGLGFVFVVFRTLFWWFPKIKIYLMPGSDKYYQDVRISMSLFFIMIAVMITLHLDVVLGAFVVGVFLATFFEHNKDLEHKLAPFGFGFLITVFFVNVGTSIDIQTISLELIKDSLILTFAMILVRILGSLIFYKELKENFILFGFSLSMPLTLLIATATLAHQNKIITDYWYSVFVLTSVLEVLVVMVGVKTIDKLIKRV